nr:Imm1 family immunity protein [Bacillus safensis]
MDSLSSDIQIVYPFQKVEKIETIEHFIAGSPLYVPSSSYINREQAYQIVQHFLTTKKVPDFVEWVELRNIDFQHDMKS